MNLWEYMENIFMENTFVIKRDQLGDPELAIEVYSWENHETQRQIFQKYLITGNQIKQWEERR